MRVPSSPSPYFIDKEDDRFKKGISSPLVEMKTLPFNSTDDNNNTEYYQRINTGEPFPLLFSSPSKIMKKMIKVKKTLKKIKKTRRETTQIMSTNKIQRRRQSCEIEDMLKGLQHAVASTPLSSSSSSSSLSDHHNVGQSINNILFPSTKTTVKISSPKPKPSNNIYKNSAISAIPESSSKSRKTSVNGTTNAINNIKTKNSHSYSARKSLVKKVVNKSGDIFTRQFGLLASSASTPTKIISSPRAKLSSSAAAAAAAGVTPIKKSQYRLLTAQTPIPQTSLSRRKEYQQSVSTPTSSNKPKPSTSSSRAPSSSSKYLTAATIASASASALNITPKRQLDIQLMSTSPSDTDILKRMSQQIKERIMLLKDNRKSVSSGAGGRNLTSSSSSTPLNKKALTPSSIKKQQQQSMQKLSLNKSIIPEDDYRIAMPSLSTPKVGNSYSSKGKGLGNESAEVGSISPVTPPSPLSMSEEKPVYTYTSRSLNTEPLELKTALSISRSPLASNSPYRSCGKNNLSVNARTPTASSVTRSTSKSKTFSSATASSISKSNISSNNNNYNNNKNNTPVSVSNRNSTPATAPSRSQVSSSSSSSNKKKNRYSTTKNISPTNFDYEKENDDDTYINNNNVFGTRTMTEIENENVDDDDDGAFESLMSSCNDVLQQIDHAILTSRSIR